jgi:hypothetical protein
MPSSHSRLVAVPSAVAIALAFALPARRAAAADDQPTKAVRVVDPEGNPVADARVVPWAMRVGNSHGSWSPDGFGDSKPPELKTDDDGRVTIPFPRFADKFGEQQVDELTCRVTHPDFVESVYNDVDVRPGSVDALATIELGRGDVVEVAALAGDEPLPIEHVYACWSSDSYGGHNGTTITAEGMRRLPRLPPGPELLQLIYLPDEGEPLFSQVDPLLLTDGKRRKLRMQLEPGARVAGRFDDSVPRPVKNGCVVGQVIQFLEADETGDFRDEDIHWRVWAQVDEDGKFWLPAMPAGELQLIAMCDGFIAKSGAPPSFASDHEREQGNRFFNRAQVFTVGGGANEPIALAMTPTAAYEFHVVDPDGHPLAGVELAFSPNVGWWGWGSQIYCWPLQGSADYLKSPDDAEQLNWRDHPFHAVTDAEGVARLGTVPLNEDDYVAWNDEWVRGPAADGAPPQRLKPKPGGTHVIDVRMRRREPAPH